MVTHSLVQELMKFEMIAKSGLRSLIFLNLYETVVATFPRWFPTMKAFCLRSRQKPAFTLSNKKTALAEIEFERSHPPNTQSRNTSSHTRIDSVVHYVTTIPAIHTLLCTPYHDYLPHEFEALLVDTDVYFKLDALSHTDGVIELIRFKLFSYEHDVQYLQAFVDKCNAEYERKMLNKLGTSLYFFDMVTPSKNKRTTQNSLPTSHIIYTKHKFTTTRTFDNVFFEEREHVKNHLEFFLTRRDWYEKKGIPYTLGFMFHGEPGCGKTSSVKAIANTARRHVINIQLSQIKSKEQLRHLFFNDEIHVYDGTKTERYTIPVHERMYVIEDIDAMGDTILERGLKKPVVEKEKKQSTGDAWLDKLREDEDDTEPLDLSFLLNLLDGTLEASGRILVISSNFPERIDRALIRPGRIDMIVRFKKCNRVILREMVDSFYDQTFNDWTSDLMDYKWTPAEVNQILFRNFNKPDDAIAELKNMQPSDLYGFRTQTVVTDFQTFTSNI